MGQKVLRIQAYNHVQIEKCDRGLASLQAFKSLNIILLDLSIPIIKNAQQRLKDRERPLPYLERNPTQKMSYRLFRSHSNALSWHKLEKLPDDSMTHIYLMERQFYQIKIWRQIISFRVINLSFQIANNFKETNAQRNYFQHARRKPTSLKNRNILKPGLLPSTSSCLSKRSSPPAINT